MPLAFVSLDLLRYPVFAQHAVSVIALERSCAPRRTTPLRAFGACTKAAPQILHVLTRPLTAHDEAGHGCYPFTALRALAMRTIENEALSFPGKQCKHLLQKRLPSTLTLFPCSPLGKTGSPKTEPAESGRWLITTVEQVAALNRRPACGVCPSGRHALVEDRERLKPPQFCTMCLDRID